MKVMHIESGLGNQMLGYAEYLSIKKSNPNEECYIETILYEVEECHSKICQWNGYELDRIFNINVPNIKEKFSKEEWAEVINSVRKSHFWELYWDYPNAVCDALNMGGFRLYNVCVSNDLPMSKATLRDKIKMVKSEFFKTYLGFNIKRVLRNKLQDRIIEQQKCSDKLFLVSDENLYCGFTLKFKNKGQNIELIEHEIKRAFKFPDINDRKNSEMLKLIQNTNSVAIHARRGDMLSVNGIYYKSRYFQRAVKYIKKHVTNPIFIFFCDQGSIEWCKENSEIFALDFTKDTVYFVDWNKDMESYRDMQLMTKCKHNIITNSTFGWWGAYLNENPNKITCSPDIIINTTHTF